MAAAVSASAFGVATRSPSHQLPTHSIRSSCAAVQTSLPRQHSSSKWSSLITAFGTRSSVLDSQRHVLSCSFLPGSKFLLQSSDSRRRSRGTRRGMSSVVVVSAKLSDFVGGDLLGFDLDKWSKDVEEFGCIGIYPPPEGGYEGRYATRLRREGYHIMNLSARGLGDLEAYLTKIHGVRPPHLGKQAIARWYLPPKVDYRLSLLPKDCKGLVLWVIEAKVLSKTELQFLALLPAIRPKVKVIAEVGSWRSFKWKPLKEVAGLPLTTAAPEAAAPKALPGASSVQDFEKEKEKKPADKVIA
ncbi:hypothetical protein R1sor_002236 [Riccia sorocarpa]|uniref:NAD(P)H-quinone oxidoreductase subunit N, chloroplastic n=1 Tax=Riccia sorocarpa TaxID=122646 RepID=A0ABD3H471_9MARC